MPGPLDGVRIVDLTSTISGPVATIMLGNRGRRRVAAASH